MVTTHWFSFARIPLFFGLCCEGEFLSTAMPLTSCAASGPPEPFAGSLGFMVFSAPCSAFWSTCRDPQTSLHVHSTPSRSLAQLRTRPVLRAPYSALALPLRALRPLVGGMGVGMMFVCVSNEV
ncbi:hypothetical protein LSM04_005930 [Trypanosoma melophagium]|uniref:uncharacterized protein n=1 Tax=Trypanosoma melophagium TaxID=715481 RepID=UPI00351A3836|nr:hypothetical protein LSM04_005930 [Trypanosoma melophagium]